LERLAAASLELSDQQLAALETYYSLLTAWNEKVNLTSLQLDDYSDQAIDRLLIEPIQATASVEHSVLTWWDIGSGGGSPALPFKIVRPSAALTMVESRSKKVAFLREAVRRLGLADADVVHGRLEELAKRQESHGRLDLITVRAVRPDDRLFADCLRLLRATGRLLLFRSAGTAFGVPPGFESVEQLQLRGGASLLLVLQRQ
jgi:16S rRNA (guanine527-N7)-methyltransferase